MLKQSNTTYKPIFPGSKINVIFLNVYCNTGTWNFACIIRFCTNTQGSICYCFWWECWCSERLFTFIKVFLMINRRVGIPALASLVPNSIFHQMSSVNLLMRIKQIMYLVQVSFKNARCPSRTLHVFVWTCSYLWLIWAI